MYSGGDDREGLEEGYAERGACVRIAGPEAEVARRRPIRERLCSPQDTRRGGLEGAHRDVCGRAHASAGVVGDKPGDPEPAPKRKPSRMEEMRAARVTAAVAGSTGNGGVQPLPSVTGRRVMIARKLLVYLAEPDQIVFWGFGVGGALTAHARRPARSRLQRRCRI